MVNKHRTMKYYLAGLIIITLIACNSGEGHKNLDCRDAKIDENLETLWNYNKTFYDEHYSGLVTAYYDENETQKKQVLHYIDGALTKSESFYENGDLKMVRNIKCNSTHGKSIYYFDGNKKGYEMEYELGRMHGIGTSYYENGSIMKKVEFKNDLRDGKQIEFAESGDTLLFEIFKEGKKIK